MGAACELRYLLLACGLALLLLQLLLTLLLLLVALPDRDIAHALPVKATLAVRCTVTFLLSLASQTMRLKQGQRK